MLTKTRNTLLLAFTILVVVEISLQVRSHFRYGQSVFNAIATEPTFNRNTETGLRLLRPNHRTEGSEAIIVTNSLGFRDEPLAKDKPPGQYRIALVGASTVMGTYTRNNEDTLPYQLQSILAETTGHSKIRVINAGIAGYNLYEQRRLVSELLSELSVDHYVLYPGFNDLTGYCRTDWKTSADKDEYSLPALSLPKWLLTTELLTKNTVSLRTSLAGQKGVVDPATLNTGPYLEAFEQLAAALKATGKPVLVVGNSWAFRRGMSEKERSVLSETARYYNSCFDTDGLEQLFERHNKLIEDTAVAHGFRYFNLHDELPGGREFFGDSTHFSVRGTREAAEIMAKHVKLGRQPATQPRG